MASDTSTASSSQRTALVAKKRAKKDKDPDSKALWEAVVREQWRREQQRRRMVRWRQRKKETVSGMFAERRCLEKKLQRRVLRARMVTDGVVPEAFGEAFQLIAIEEAALMSENLMLQEKIASHVKFEKMLQLDTQELMRELYKYSVSAVTKAKGAAQEEKEAPQLQSDQDWRVNFPDGAPSFFFQPFTTEEFDDILSHSKLYAPNSVLVRRHERYTAHVRFTKRLSCSLDNFAGILSHLELWPELASSRGWGHSQTGRTCCQVVQSFRSGADVLAVNIPGKKHLRYLALAHNFRLKSSDGKRVNTFVMVITDSEANARIREAEGQQRDVQWIREGGMYMTITEVDANTVDVVIDQWAGCANELHGSALYIDWVRYPVSLEQVVSPAMFVAFRRDT